MGSPLREAVEAYLARGASRFHMPGHKGLPFAPFGESARYDITEVRGADSLYEAGGPIAAAEARFAALYGAAGSLLSAGGSTLCIQAMLALAARPGGKVICGRGVHTAAVNAMALLDLHPRWIFPETDSRTGLARAVTPAQVEGALAACPDARAVYLTSPDYFGVTCDVAAIAALCHRRGVPLLVDNAHGAHLRFLTPDRHPISLGADLCCDSAHKTLPALTGGALLHVGNPRFLPDAKRRMSLFGSTSPSYLILLSLDGLLPWLENGAASEELALAAAEVAGLEALARERGLLLPEDKGEPLRLSVGFGPSGLSGGAFRDHLERHGLEPEYLSQRFCIFLASAHSTGEDFARLRSALEHLPQGRYVPEPAPSFSPPRQAVSLREAALAPGKTVPVEEAEGRVCAGMVCPCPPGIPVALPGERLDKILCSLLKMSGILTVNVLE